MSELGPEADEAAQALERAGLGEAAAEAEVRALGPEGVDNLVSAGTEFGDLSTMIEDLKNQIGSLEDSLSELKTLTADSSAAAAELGPESKSALKTIEQARGLIEQGGEGAEDAARLSEKIGTKEGRAELTKAAKDESLLERGKNWAKENPKRLLLGATAAGLAVYLATGGSLDSLADMLARGVNKAASAIFKLFSRIAKALLGGIGQILKVLFIAFGSLIGIGVLAGIIVAIVKRKKIAGAFKSRGGGGLGVMGSSTYAWTSTLAPVIE